MLVGMNAVMYRNTGTYNSVTWDEITSIGDCTVTADWDVVKQALRGNAVALGYKTFLNLEITFKMEASLNAADYVAMRSAFLSRSPVDMLVLNDDKSTNGAWGFRADFLVTSHNEDQGAGAALMPEFKLIPSPATSDTGAVPKTAEVGANNTITYSAIT
jgi:hypothetical protein